MSTSTVERPHWPWPGATATDRARAIANGLLLRLPPDEQERAVREARAVGETWLGPDLLRWDDDDVITTAEAAELVRVSPSMIRKWHSSGLLPNRGRSGRYRAGDVLDCARRVRRERAARAALA